MTMNVLVAKLTLMVTHSTTAPAKILNNLCCTIVMPSGVGSSHTSNPTTTAMMVPYFLPASSNLFAIFSTPSMFRLR